MCHQDAEQEHELRKKQEEVMREKMLAQEAKKLEKVLAGGIDPGLGRALSWELGGPSSLPVPGTRGVGGTVGDRAPALVLGVAGTCVSCPGSDADPGSVRLQRNKWQQQELIAELRRRQAKEHRPVYEGKDGAIEDIITGRSCPSPPLSGSSPARGWGRPGGSCSHGPGATSQRPAPSAPHPEVPDLRLCPPPPQR